MAQAAIIDTVTPDDVRTFIAIEIGRQLTRLGNDPWHDPASGAAHANCSKAHLLKCIRQGRGPAYVGSGRMMRMRRSSIDTWLKGTRHAA